MTDRPRLEQIQKILKARYRHVKTQLHYRNAFELLIATILSAQCTDRQVNRVTGPLFDALSDPAAFAATPRAKVEEMIRSTGFFRNKAKNIQACCEALLRDYGGEVPETLEELVKLPGVGRKTANLVLGVVHGIPGMVVDTHVARISQRLGFTNKKDPAKIEQDLMKTVPKDDWNDFSLRLIYFGREICSARKPSCPDCPVLGLCPFPDKTTAAP